MAQLILKNIDKKYSNENHVVKNFSLQIKDKEFVVFVGPSGCGKSTMLRMIAGLEEITSGELWINGELMNFTEPKDRNLSMVFQNYALYPHMNVYKNMAFGAKVHKIPKEEIDRRVRAAAEILGISHLLKSYPKALSGGQKQRVAIGSVMVLKPNVFLMDEPLSNLDAKLRNQMRIEMARIHKQLGATFIYVTHDQVEAMTLGTKIVVMNQGMIQQAASPSEIYNNPKNQFVAGFMGSPAMNFLEVEIKEVDSNLVAQLEDRTMILPQYQAKALIQKGYLNKRLILGFRPNHLYTAAYILDTGKKTGLLKCQVRHRELLGAEVVIYGQVGRKEITAKMPSGYEVEREQVIDLYLDLEQAIWFDSGTKENILYREGNENE